VNTYSAISTAQRWAVAGGPLATAGSHRIAGASIFPVPAEHGRFTVDLGSQPTAEVATVEVFNLQGQRVYGQQFAGRQPRLAVETALAPGLYLVQVRQGAGFLTQKVLVL
jgi:hypothetical protein